MDAILFFLAESGLSVNHTKLLVARKEILYQLRKVTETWVKNERIKCYFTSKKEKKIS